MRHTASGTRALAPTTPTIPTSYTPGPWHEHSHRQIGPDEGIVAEVWSAVGGGDAIQQADANVRLIAAAPDLYQALRSALVVVAGCNGNGLYDDQEQAIRVALRKAAEDFDTSDSTTQPEQMQSAGADFPAMFSAEQILDIDAGSEDRLGVLRRCTLSVLSSSGEQLRTGFAPVQMHDALVELVGKVAAYRFRMEADRQLAEIALERLKVVSFAIDEVEREQEGQS